MTFCHKLEQAPPKHGPNIKYLGYTEEFKDWEGRYGSMFDSLSDFEKCIFRPKYVTFYIVTWLKLDKGVLEAKLLFDV